MSNLYLARSMEGLVEEKIKTLASKLFKALLCSSFRYWQMSGVAQQTQLLTGDIRSIRLFGHTDHSWNTDTNLY